MATHVKMKNSNALKLNIVLTLHTIAIRQRIVAIRLMSQAIVNSKLLEALFRYIIF